MWYIIKNKQLCEIPDDVLKFKIRNDEISADEQIIETNEHITQQNLGQKKIWKDNHITHKWRCDKCQNVISELPCCYCSSELNEMLCSSNIHKILNEEERK